MAGRNNERGHGVRWTALLAAAFVAAALGLLTPSSALASPATKGAPPPAGQSVATQPGVVLELFTSQACSSCPAADALLAAHADRDDVLALAWHVDYWDYLGWRDTFGDPSHSARQRAYAEVMGEGVYTPQVVVNGVAQGVGHRRDEVDRMLQAAKVVGSANSGFVPLSVSRNESGYRVSLDADAAARRQVEDATLFLVWFDPRHEVPISAGENAGRRIVYRNTVRGMQMLGSVMDGRLDVSLSLAAMRRVMPNGKSCALILQRTEKGLPGAILGAAVLGGLPPG